MNEFGWFLITVAAAVLFGEMAARIKIPLGGIIGALFGVILLNVITRGHAVLYSPIKVIMQITIGAISGSRVGKEELKSMLRLAKPALIIYPMYFLLAFLFGLAIYRFSELDAITSMLMACPGGASDIALLAEDFGADAAYTGILHVVRVVFCCVALPPVFTYIIQKKDKTAQKKGTAFLERPSGALPPVKTIKNAAAEKGHDEQTTHGLSGTEARKAPLKTAALLGFAAIGGILFKRLGIASGAIIGSLLFSIIFSCIWGKCRLPKWIRKFQLITTGAYVGSTVTLSVLAGISILAVPVALLILEIIVSVAAVSFLVYRTKTLDLPTIFPCCSPGGMAEMILLADEIGGDVSTVAVIQAFRIVFVVTLFPSLLSILLTLAA